MEAISKFARNLLLGAFFFTLFGATLSAQVSTTERSALMAFYNATGGSNWTNHTNWGTANAVSTWYGVTVSDNKVTQLNLKQNNLQGNIPIEFYNLTNLTFLHLRGNSLSGSLSPLIGNLNKLTFLGLNNNQFSGSLPSEMGNLLLLTELYLQENGFTGPVPGSFSTLSKLNYLYLLNNEVSGLPAFSSNPQLRVQGNNLEFDDLEINIGSASSVFVYSPQALVGAPTSKAEIQGSNVTLQSNIGGTNNTYQWYKNGVLIPTATGANLVLNNVQPSNNGVYTCKAQNTLITGLTLSYAPITLTVLPYAINTSAAENIGAVSADVPYNVNFGAATITEHGVVVAISSNPTTADIKTASGVVTGGANLVNVSSLSQNTKYYARAYAVEGGVTYYGNEVSFTTLPYVITTSAAKDITTQDADIPYNIDFGLTTMSEHGVVFGIAPNPTIADNKIPSGSIANGPHTVTITPLSQTTIYYVKAYAISGGQEYYGNEVSFTTYSQEEGVLVALYNATDGIIGPITPIGNRIVIFQPGMVLRFSMAM